MIADISVGIPRVITESAQLLPFRLSTSHHNSWGQFNKTNRTIIASTKQVSRLQGAKFVRHKYKQSSRSPYIRWQYVTSQLPWSHSLCTESVPWCQGLSFPRGGISFPKVWENKSILSLESTSHIYVYVGILTTNTWPTKPHMHSFIG